MGQGASSRSLRARTLAFNAATVDVTDTESVGRWRELLDGAGVKTARITGSGIFKDASTDETVRQYFFNGTLRKLAGDRSAAGNGRGPFQIASLEYAGQHDGEVSFDMGLESAGAGVTLREAAMVNRNRGEIEAILDGKSYRLCLTLGALAELEHAFGEDDMLAVAERFEAGRIAAQDAIRMIGAGTPLPAQQVGNSGPVYRYDQSNTLRVP